MMSMTKIFLGLILLAVIANADDEALDAEFLEWLGQAAEVEELGVDINGLLDAQEQQPQSESNEENSK